MDNFRETAWDHIAGENTATFSTSEKKWIRVIERLKTEYPDEVDIRKVNQDGSIYVHLPVDWMKIKPKRKTSLTPEQIAASTARLELARQKKLEDLRQAGVAG